MRSQTFIASLALLALMAGTVSIYAEQQPAAGKDAAVATPTLSPYKDRLLQLKTPRDKMLAEINVLEEKIAERKKAIGEEKPEVAKLAAEVESLSAKLTSTMAALDAKYSDDAQIKELHKKASEARRDFSTAHQAFNAEFNANAQKRMDEAAATLKAEAEKAAADRAAAAERAAAEKAAAKEAAEKAAAERAAAAEKVAAEIAAAAKQAEKTDAESTEK